MRRQVEIDPLRIQSICRYLLLSSSTPNSTPFTMAFKAFVVLMALCLVSLASGFVAPTSMARNGERVCLFSVNNHINLHGVSFACCRRLSPPPPLLQYRHAASINLLRCVWFLVVRVEPPRRVRAGPFLCMQESEVLCDPHDAMIHTSLQLIDSTPYPPLDSVQL